MATIKKYSDGRYHACVYLGTDSRGNKIKKSIAARTKKEVLAKVKEIEEEHAESIEIAGGDATFARWAERWAQHKSIAVSENVFAHYKGMLKLAVSRFGVRKLSTIQSFEIQDYIDELFINNPNTGGPASKKVLLAHVQMLSQIFEYAIQNRAVDFNPAKFVTVPKGAVSTERRALTTQEREWIEQTDNRLKPLVMVMLFAGLRRGEAIPLRWTDINLKKRTITVNKAVTFVHNQPHIKGTKTKSGNRTVYIIDKLFDYLKEYKTHRPDSELYCPSLNGEMFTETSFRRAWESFQRDLNITAGLNPVRKSKYDPRFKNLEIENITCHMLRHSFASMMYESGVGVKVAQSQMGHASPSVTMGIYTHISQDFASNEMSKMNGI